MYSFNCCSNDTTTNEISQIDKIVVINRTNLRPFFDSVDIVDTTAINSILQLKKKMLPFIDSSMFVTRKQPAVKNSFGFYEVQLFYKKIEIQNLHIIYTVYDGVIINTNNQLYKNDALEMKIHREIEQRISKIR
jgi:hypothetical protein